MINYLNNYFVTMFGIGYIKKIPGTISSFATVVFLFIYFHYFELSKNYFLLILSVIFIYSFIAVNLYIKDKANKDPKEVVVDEFIGADEPISLKEVKLKNVNDNAEKIIYATGAFIAIGHDPATSLFKNKIKMDNENYIITKPDSTETNIKGVYAAGDVKDKVFRQAVTAAGMGCMAALEAEKYIAENY